MDITELSVLGGEWAVANVTVVSCYIPLHHEKQET